MSLSVTVSTAELLLVAAEVLEGHSDEIFSCAFNYEGDTVITGSKDMSAHVHTSARTILSVEHGCQDNTCRIWKDNFFTPADEDDQRLGWLVVPRCWKWTLKSKA